jgi:hypothetical protein
MHYTKLIIQAADNVLLLETYIATLTIRWGFNSVTKTGGTQWHRMAADAEWTHHDSCTPETYNSDISKEQYDLIDVTTVPGFPVGTTYFETMRFWESAAVAQDYVAAIQTSNLPGITVSYEGTTAPTAV